MSVGFTGVEIHPFAKQCLLLCGPSLSVLQSDLCLTNRFQSTIHHDACLTNRHTQRLWIQNFLGQTGNFPSRGQRIYSKFTLAFYGNKMRQTELKTSVSLPPSKQLLCEIYILNQELLTEHMCG